jgi:hypothetical protein
MAWRISDPRAGTPPITTTSTTKGCPLGTIVRAVEDSTNEAGEFIYLQGIGSTAVGSIVIWDGNFLTTLTTDAAILAKPIAFAMSANVASQYGWYQISGVATAKKTATIILPNVKLYVGADALTATSATGKSIIGLRSGNAATLASAITTVEVVCNRPTLSGLLITS